MEAALNFSPNADAFGGIGASPVDYVLRSHIPQQRQGELVAESPQATHEDIITADELTTEQEVSQTRRWITAAKRTGQMAVAVTTLSPANELLRAGAIAGSYAYSHSIGLTATVAGASTLLVESAGALASAEILATDKAERLFTAINKKLKGKDTQHVSPITKALTTLATGTTVGMTIEQAEDPTRTVEQNRSYGVRTAAWLAGTVAVGTALTAEGINVAIERPEVALPIVGGIALFEAVRHKWHTMRYPKKVKNPESATWNDSDKYAKYRLLTDQTELIEAAITEQDVWDEKKFGKLDEEGYGKYIAHSRTFGAFDNEGNCIGVNRMFGATEEILPPFLSMDFDDITKQSELAKGALEGMVEELGTVAVVKEYRGKGLNARLWRLAMRDAKARGVEQWGIIMEPKRVEHMNKQFGFTFEQVGPMVDYQGGDCAPFVTVLDDCLMGIRRKSFLKHYWFTRKSLKP